MPERTFVPHNIELTKTAEGFSVRVDGEELGPIPAAAVVQTLGSGRPEVWIGGRAVPYKSLKVDMGIVSGPTAGEHFKVPEIQGSATVLPRHGGGG